MKFKYKNPLILSILIYLLCAVQLVMIVINLCKLFWLFNMYSVNIALDIVQIVISLLIIIVAILLLSISYKIEKNKIKMNVGFIDITRGKIAIDTVLNILLKKDENKLYINFLPQESDPIIMEIVIAPNKYEAFRKKLQEINPHVVYLED